MSATPPHSRGRRLVLQCGLAGSLLPAGAWAWSQGAAAAEAPKLALVIGNSGYRQVPALLNPANDARAMSAALAEAGFSVTTVLDASRDPMQEAIRKHVEALAARKAVGLFYFAGHGLQVDWRNYLVPVDATIASTGDIPAACVDVGDLVAGIRRAANPMNVIILDACRDNPFARGAPAIQKGLSQMDAPPGTLLAYATAPGNLASDGARAHGLYTEHLLREMRVREAKIEDVFKRVRLGVRLASKGAQIPWESTSLEEDFYFLPPASGRAHSREEADRLHAEERLAYEKARDAPGAGPLEEYLRRYPSGRFVELAQLLLDRRLALLGEQPVRLASSVGNPHTQGSARADTAFRVGDFYAVAWRDLRAGTERRLEQVVTSIGEREVTFNGGVPVYDLLGNAIKVRGMHFSPRQDVPLEYAVGKRWSTRYELLAGGTGGSVELDLRIAARERVTVAAGTFDCFRIEGRGLNTSPGRDPVELSLTVWRAPEIVRRAIAVEEARRSRGRLVLHERIELVSYRQA